MEAYHTMLGCAVVCALSAVALGAVAWSASRCQARALASQGRMLEESLKTTRESMEFSRHILTRFTAVANIQAEMYAKMQEEREARKAGREGKVLDNGDEEISQEEVYFIGPSYD